LRYAWIPCVVSLGLVAAACGSSNSGDDDDNGGGSGESSGARGGSSGNGGSGGGTVGGSSGKGGTGGTAGTGGSSGSAGSGTQPIPGGPFPYPQNKKPAYCSLTTVADASGKLQTIYNTWKATYVVTASPGLRVSRPENGNDTVSEGIGYGMLAAVYMNDRATFDGIWAFGKAKFNAAHLMDWHLNADGSVASGGTGSATDADEDMAWALIMASAQWQSGTYLDDAKKMIGAMRTSEIGADYTLSPGNSWGGSDRTYPDYFSPAYFRVFKAVTGDPIWDKVIDRNYEILAAVTGEHGLVPDYTTTSYDLSQAYKYDACRTPWRIGMDFCWNNEPRAKTYLDKIGGFFNTQGVSNIGDGYSLTGTKTSTFANMAFIGPAGVAGMAGFPKLLDDAFTFGATGNGGTTGYYQQSLRVITMLMMSGNFLDYTKP
jgi:endo-1,4-beta-D-glucanase Y